MTAKGAWPVLVLAALLAAGCDGPQSTWNSAGRSAESIEILGNVMFIGAAVTTVIVTAAILFAFRPRSWQPSQHFWLIGGGVIFPTAVLTALVVFATAVGHSMRGAAPDDSPKLDVTAQLYWWDVRYKGAAGGADISAANHIVLPAGQPAEIRLKSPDVIHSFWIPSLAGKVDVIPGRTNRIVLEPRQAGAYRGQCAEYCGLMHARMAFTVRVVSPDEYRLWLAQQAEPAYPPATPFLRQGQELFISQGCGACHRVRGLDGADGELGPDLTHAGSRPTIAAGTLQNGVGNLAAWIASSQHLKPGNKMPSFDRLTGEELRAVAAYVDSLK